MKAFDTFAILSWVGMAAIVYFVCLGGWKGVLALRQKLKAEATAVETAIQNDLTSLKSRVSALEVATRTAALAPAVAPTTTVTQPPQVAA